MTFGTFGHAKVPKKKSFSINKQPAPHNTYIEKHLVFAEKFPQKILLPAVKSFRQGTEVLI